MRTIFGGYSCPKCECKELVFESVGMEGNSVVIRMRCGNSSCNMKLYREIDLYEFLGADGSKPKN